MAEQRRAGNRTRLAKFEEEKVVVRADLQVLLNATLADAGFANSQLATDLLDRLSAAVSYLEEEVRLRFTLDEPSSFLPDAFLLDRTAQLLSGS